MMDWLGRTRRFWAMGLLAAVLLSGCGSTGGEPAAASAQSVQEEAEEETTVQELQKQIIAVMNLNRDADNQISTDATLAAAADFFLSYVLQNPETYLTEGTDSTNLDDMLSENAEKIHAFVYDGKLSAVEAGKVILDALKTLDSAYSQGASSYKNLVSIAIVYGEGEKGSVWLVLAENEVTFEPSGSTTTGSGQTGDPDDEEPEGEGSGNSENENAGSGEGTEP